MLTIFYNNTEPKANIIKKMDAKRRPTKKYTHPVYFHNTVYVNAIPL